jgi:signal transduction histidine kinase
MMRNVRTEAGLRETVQALGEQLARALSAGRVLIAAHETEGERAFLWEIEPSHNDTPAALRVSELTPAQRDGYFFAALRESPSCLSVAFDFGSGWRCRLFVCDVMSGRRPESTMRLLTRVVRALSPAVHNVYLLHRLQANAGAVERATLARALHDDLIQSLVSAEMRVHALRRLVTDAPVAVELDRIEQIFHHEILGVRDFMQRIKPTRLEADELLDFLADHVQKFSADTGIKASFFADVRQVSLSAAMCSEVARVVQEALSNVRKHSGAHSASVTLTENSGHWSLIIEDDGKGLGDSPRYPSPAVIKECIRSLRGELQLRPAAGGGLRLEIAFLGRAEAGDTRLEQEGITGNTAIVPPPMQFPLVVNACVAEVTRHAFPGSSTRYTGRR